MNAQLLRFRNNWTQRMLIRTAKGMQSKAHKYDHSVEEAIKSREEDITALKQLRQFNGR